MAAHPGCDRKHARGILRRSGGWQRTVRSNQRGVPIRSPRPSRWANGETDPVWIGRWLRQRGNTVSSTDQNKAVVRRFMTEALAGGDADALDELLAPNYHNPMMGGMDRAGFKAMLPALRTVISGMSFTIVDLVAEGDAVVARFTSTMTLATGKTIETRGMTYYRLADGKIVEDDPIQTPDLTQELAALMTPRSA